MYVNCYLHYHKYPLPDILPLLLGYLFKYILAIIIMGSRETFVPHSSKNRPTITWWIGRKVLFYEAEGNSEYESLVVLEICVIVLGHIPSFMISL